MHTACTLMHRIKNAQHKMASYMSRNISDILFIRFSWWKSATYCIPDSPPHECVYYGRGSMRWHMHINQPWWENLKKQVEKRRDGKSDRKTRKVQAQTHRRRRAGGPNQYDTGSTNHRRLTVLVCTLNRHGQPEILLEEQWSKLQENFSLSV